MRIASYCKSSSKEMVNCTEKHRFPANTDCFAKKKWRYDTRIDVNYDRSHWQAAITGHTCDHTCLWGRVCGSAVVRRDGEFVLAARRNVAADGFQCANGDSLWTQSGAKQAVL